MVLVEDVKHLLLTDISATISSSYLQSKIYVQNKSNKISDSSP